MATADAGDAGGQSRSLHEVLRGLPLLDEVFLGMQAMNIDLVDAQLETMESALRAAYIERE